MPNLSKPKESYTIREVAAHLSCSEQHVYNLIEAGRLQAFNIATDIGKRGIWRISRKALEQLTTIA